MSGIKQQKPAFLCSVWLVICFSFAIQTLSFADTFHENSVDPLEWLEDEETRREMEETDHHNFFSEGYVPIGVHFGGHFLSGGAIKSFLGSSSAHTEADTKEDPEYKGLGNSHVSLCRVNHTLHWDNPPKVRFMSSDVGVDKFTLYAPLKRKKVKLNYASLLCPRSLQCFANWFKPRAETATMSKW